MCHGSICVALALYSIREDKLALSPVSFVKVCLVGFCRQWKLLLAMTIVFQSEHCARRRGHRGRRC